MGPFSGPKSEPFKCVYQNTGPRIRAQSGDPPNSKKNSQVSTSWTVYNCMDTTATRSGHAVLRCNLDETMLPRGFGDHKGVILKKRLHGQKQIVSSKNSKRGSLTFVAIIGDNATVQPRLPQVLMGTNIFSEFKTSKKSNRICLLMCMSFVESLGGWTTYCLHRF